MDGFAAQPDSNPITTGAVEVAMAIRAIVIKALVWVASEGQLPSTSITVGAMAVAVAIWVGAIGVLV